LVFISRKEFYPRPPESDGLLVWQWASQSLPRLNRVFNVLCDATIRIYITLRQIDCHVYRNAIFYSI